jgi:hypothetical protein
MNDDDKSLPDHEDVFDSAEQLMLRITAQLTSQLAQVRPPRGRTATAAPGLLPR